MAWSTNDLAKQMQRSLRNFWPRAESNLYAAAKKLVEHGYATAADEPTGGRPRTVYTITAQGRAALRDWVAQPGAGPALEFEKLLKVFYADNGDRDDLLARLAEAKAEAEGYWWLGRQIAQGYVDGTGPFPERAAVNSLVFEFIVRFNEMVWEWADWAQARVGDWPNDPGEWPQPDDVYRRAAAEGPWQRARPPGS